jgi:hypothetical protein
VSRCKAHINCQFKDGLGEDLGLIHLSACGQDMLAGSCPGVNEPIVSTVGDKFHELPSVF